jgi:hypothetical protein
MARTTLQSFLGSGCFARCRVLLNARHENFTNRGPYFDLFSDHQFAQRINSFGLPLFSQYQQLFSFLIETHCQQEFVVQEQGGAPVQVPV